MRNLILTMAAVLLMAPTADARLFGRAEDCTCHLDQYAAAPISMPQAKPVPLVAAAAPKVEDKHVQAKVGKINGTADLNEDADKVYTVLCLPRNYRTCEHCMRVLNAFNGDRDLLDVRAQTQYYVLVDGSARFSPLWRRRVPEVSRGQTVVLVMQGNHVLAREVAPNLVGFGDRLKKKLCDKFCPQCQPTTPPPAEEPPVDEPDTTIVQPPPSVEPAHAEVSPVALLLTGIVAGFVAWIAMFRRGM
jgi:hypothetical protein